MFLLLAFGKSTLTMATTSIAYAAGSPIKPKLIMTASIAPHLLDQPPFVPHINSAIPARLGAPLAPLLLAWTVFTSALAICTSLVLLHYGHHLRTQRSHAHHYNETHHYRIALLARLVCALVYVAGEVVVGCAPAYSLASLIVLEALAYKALDLKTTRHLQVRQRPSALATCAPLCLLVLRVVRTQHSPPSHPLLRTLRMVLYSLDIYLTGICAAQWMHKPSYRPAVVQEPTAAACLGPAAATTPRNLNAPAAAPCLPAAATPTTTIFVSPTASPVSSVTPHTRTHVHTQSYTPAYAHTPAASYICSSSTMSGNQCLLPTTTARSSKAGPYSAMWAEA